MPSADDAAQLNLVAPPLNARLWLLILLTGVGAGLAGGGLMKLLRWVQHVCFRYSQGLFVHGVEGVSPLRRVLVLIAAGIVGGIALSVGRRLFSRMSINLPEAVHKNRGELPESATAYSSLLSIVLVGMGAAVGREASLKEAGGLAGAKLSDIARLQPAERQLLVACGIGAGMAAAYNVPFGGAVFTLEVLLGTVSAATSLAAFVTSFVATAVSWLLLPNEPTYKIPHLASSASLMAFALLAGPLMGLGSVWFVRGIHWAKDHKPAHASIFFLPVAMLGALGLMAGPFPELLGNGKDVAQLALGVQMGTGLLCWLLILRPLATIFVLRAGIPGGLFTPTCSFGTLLGAVLGQCWSFVAPSTDKRSYALIGMGAVLAACTEAPVSSLVFVLELTWHATALIAPLLIAICGAAITYRRFETRSTY